MVGKGILLGGLALLEYHIVNLYPLGVRSGEVGAVRVHIVMRAA